MAYKRKTEDEYNIQGFYCGQWENVTTESTPKEAKDQLKCYRENEPNTAFRIKKERVRLSNDN